MIPWPDSNEPGAQNCPGKGLISPEIKDDALFCATIDSGDSKCEKDTFESCISNEIQRYSGFPGSCDTYDIWGGQNCYSWKENIVNQCKKQTSSVCKVP